MAFALVAVGYAALMTTYNLGLKHIVIVDVLAIALGFVLRAVAGAVAVDVSISPWLLVCTLLLALLIGFGKRRYELVSLARPGAHRRNLDVYSERLLDQAVAVTAGGTLLAYAMYTFDSKSAPVDHRFMLTVPIVAYGVRYLYLLYQHGQGGTPRVNAAVGSRHACRGGSLGCRERSAVLSPALERESMAGAHRCNMQRILDTNHSNLAH